MPKSEVEQVRILERNQPLANVLYKGRYGTKKCDGPGVRLSMRGPLTIVTIICRKGKNLALSGAMEKHYGMACPAPGFSVIGDDVSLYWAGADQWYVIASNYEDGALYQKLTQQLDGLASVSDQSHGRVILSIGGSHARDVLIKGVAVDLHPRAFSQGRCAVTRIAYISVHISQVRPDEYELLLYRSFAEDFWEWLTEMSEEFGYEILHRKWGGVGLSN